MAGLTDKCGVDLERGVRFGVALSVDFHGCICIK